MNLPEILYLYFWISLTDYRYILQTTPRYNFVVVTILCVFVLVASYPVESDRDFVTILGDLDSPHGTQLRVRNSHD